MKRAYERLLDYVVVYTTSDEKSQTVPSAEREFDLAHETGGGDEGDRHCRCPCRR